MDEQKEISSTFRDFIPEGEDPGALGSGFKDFVPAPEVTEQMVETLVPEVDEEPVVEDPTPKTTKK